MNTKVLLAVFKRNFLAYFTSPTGYVFICAFVLLSSVAAFWSTEFFNRNLANLDQLSRAFPFIMLVFVPTITMGIWAEERRQGTDELLLTIPASDFDVVLGKYLAAVAIYTASLGFSMICNVIVLRTLGSPDMGLFAGTYLGYWLVGLAMLSIGMVASFATENLTISYVLGALFNAPLVLLVFADVIFPQAMGAALKGWSMGGQLGEFARGMITLSHVLYFVTLVVVMLYLSMVFISARHWRAGAASASRGGLYATQIVALLLVGVNLCVLFGRHDVRADVTSEQLSSLSSETVDLLKNMKAEYPVRIEAFISPEVPEDYVRTRLDILSRLREMKARAGSKVILRIIPTRRFTDEAARAEQRYGITPRRVFSNERGRMSQDQIFLGVAFTRGLEKVILPFIDRGIPVEYELVRSLLTVTQEKRRKVGVLKTDAQLFGQMNMQTMGSSPNWPIIDELEKQYDVVEVDPSAPIEETYDVLLAVQPSSLNPESMENFLAAVRSGQPTAIFEDPFPLFAGNVPGTNIPKRPPGGMMMQQRPEPKGDIKPLWDLLGVKFNADDVIWQDYEPYPKVEIPYKEFVFVDKGQDRDSTPFSAKDPVSSGLQQLLFVFPGSISGLNASTMSFESLVETGTKTGTAEVQQIAPMLMFGMMQIDDEGKLTPTGRPYTLAARIQGELPAPAETDAKEGEQDESKEDSEKKTPEAKKLNVILVADIDMLHHQFFLLRERGNNPEEGFDLRFDNVPFVLNILDSLAGDDRFVEIRKRRPVHRTLTAIERATEDSRKHSTQEAKRLQDEFDEFVKVEQKKLDDKVKALEEQMKSKDIRSQDVLIQASLEQETRQKRLDAEKDRLKAKMQQEQDQIDTKMNAEIERVRRIYKICAVALPPILPLLIAVFVFISRRMQEQEGVARSRLR